MRAPLVDSQDFNSPLLSINSPCQFLTMTSFTRFSSSFTKETTVFNFSCFLAANPTVQSESLILQFYITNKS